MSAQVRNRSSRILTIAMLAMLWMLATPSSSLPPGHGLDKRTDLHYTLYQDSTIEKGGCDVTKTQISIGQVKRDISELLNRVAYGGERIILTSRGKPKAAIVSMEDYAHLEQETMAAKMARWQAWVAKSDALAAEILARRGGEPIDAEALWEAVRADREERDAQILGH
jgi:prevent-host-death family protein